MVINLSTGIVSAGHVGGAFGNALHAAGHTIAGAHAPSEASLDRLGAMLPGVPSLSVEETAYRAEVLFSAVPDDEFDLLAEGLAKFDCFTAGQLVIHVAGHYDVPVLEPVARMGALTLAIHPTMTFIGTSLGVAHLVGYPFITTAPATLLPIGRALMTKTGSTPVVVAEEDRGLYHATLAYGISYLITLVAQSMWVLETIEVEAPGTYLAPLLQAALDDMLSSGGSVLTGPVARGDIGTVREHLVSLDAFAAAGDFVDIPPIYHALIRATVARVTARGLRESPVIDRMPTELDGDISGPVASD